MKQSLTLIILAGLVMWLSPLATMGQTNLRYGAKYVVFEAEDNPSSMTHWATRTPGDPAYYLGNDLEAINQTYIEYTGPWAAAASPLSYTFVAPSTGTYRMVMRMYQPLGPSEAGDKKNDVFVRLEGNYTSQTNTTKTELEKNHKFWGRGVRKWGSCHKLEIGGTHMDAKYGLIEGESYTFVMSGRSAGCSIDYILFYDVSLGLNVQIHTDIAAALPPQYQPFSSNVFVTLDTAEINLVNVNDTYQLTATVTPDTIADKSLTWESADPSIATVDANGLVTAVANGETNITATPNAGGTPGMATVIVGEILTQDVNWSAKQLSGVTDIITDGTLLEAINFGGGTGPSVYDETVNTVPFVGKVNDREDNVWQNPATDYFSANSVQVVPAAVDVYDPAIGLPEFDGLLSKFLWTNGAPTEVTFSNLTVGNKYKIQFLAGDTRASQAGAYIVLDESFGSADTTPFVGSAGLSIVGEFTAVAESFSFLFSKVNNGSVEGINLNAYQLREVSTTSVGGNDDDPEINIYPNPASSKVFVEVKEAAVLPRLTILDLSGRVVFEGQMSSQKEAIDVSRVNPGIYLVKLQAQQEVWTKKLNIW
ncbi:MAG: Ig-like domain-containing protein [Bacteroidota bacterium]